MMWEQNYQIPRIKKKKILQASRWKSKSFTRGKKSASLRLLPATSTKFWEKYIMSSYDVIQLLKQKSDSLEYDCIYTFYEFFLGKVIV